MQAEYLQKIKALSTLCHDVVLRCKEQLPDALLNAAVLLHDNGLLVRGAEGTHACMHVSASIYGTVTACVGAPLHPAFHALHAACISEENEG